MSAGLAQRPRVNAIGVITKVTSEANRRRTFSPMTPLVERPYRHSQVGRDVPNSPQWVENSPSQQPLMIRQGDHRPIRVESHAEGQARVLRGPQVRTLSPPAVPYQRCSVLEEWPRDRKSTRLNSS